MATLQKKQIGYAGGQEGALSSVGTTCRWMGFLVAMVSVIAAMGSSGSSGVVAGLCVVNGIIGLGLCLTIDAVCHGFADVIRILKKQNGLQYSGEILSPRPTYRMVCSECGSQDFSTTNPCRCLKCGVVLSEEGPD